MMEGSYVEAMLDIRNGASALPVKSWLDEHRLTWRPMSAGLLMSGRQEDLEAAFGVSLEGAHPPVELPIPQELRDHVASITIPRPRQIMP
jgi:hypothetical protein